MTDDNGMMRVIIEVQNEDGWTTARAVLGGVGSPELCRMVTPPPYSTEINKKFHALALAIISSIIREEQPNAEITSRTIVMPRSGNG